MKILILINSKAGGGRFLKKLNEIISFLRKKNIEYELCFDHWPNEINENSSIWIIGGDGTLNYFINKYPEIRNPIAILKGGTGNDFACKLYGKITLQKQVELLMNNKINEVDVGFCNGKYFINGVGIGFDGEILKSMSKIRWLGGHLGYFLIVLIKIFTFKERNYSITFNTQEFSGRYLLMSVFNSSRTGGGFQIAPTAKIDDGFLDVITCKPLSLIRRLINLPKIEKGKHLSLPFIDHHLTKKIIIKCDSKTAAQIDGELFWSNEFSISIIEKKLNFLV